MRNATGQNFAIVEARRPGGGFVLRARYQIFLGLILAVVLPAALSWLCFDLPIAASTQYNTAIGASLSLILGVFAFRRLHIFPGIAAGGYVVTCISITFGVLAIALILLRLDYSRVLLTINYLVAVTFFTLMHLRFDAKRKYVMGVVPGGSTDKLPDLRHVTWHNISGPDGQMPPFDGVVADLHYDHGEAWNSRITAYVLRGTPVYHVKQAIEQLTGRVEIEQLSENTLGSVNPNDVFFRIKGAVDFVAALVLLIILLPMLLVIGLVVRLDSPGPALFKQRRTGFRTRPFVAYKFRTMKTALAAADDEETRRRAMTQLNDPRITRVGAFLRRTRLDELPQLINVLRGQMSLIGPRPEAVELTKWYEQEIPFYHYRHIIKPGLTGWAQVNQGHVVYVDQVREKLHLDFYYVKNFSFWLDILIVIRTVQTIFTGHGAR